MPTGEAPATPNRKVASTTLRCLTTDLLSGNGSCSIISVLESTITKSASRGSKGSLCTRTIVLRECEYGIERNRRIFCRIELAVPLVVDEFIVATMASDTRLAAISRAKIQPGQNLLRDHHLEYLGPDQTQQSSLSKRGVYAKVVWSF